MNEPGTIAALMARIAQLEARVAALESVAVKAGEHAGWMAEAIKRAVAQT